MVLAAFTDGNVPGQNIDAGPGWAFRSTDLWDPGACFDDGPGWAPANSTFSTPFAVETGNPSTSWVATQMAFRSAATPALPQPTALAFATGAQFVDAGTCSSVVTLNTLETLAPARAGTGFWINLGAASATFFADRKCQYPIGQLYLGAGTSSASLYFIGTASGPMTLAASALGFSTVTQLEQIH
jgi:hypothetical protein